ncbi:uncharacterized protein MYCGRDRAFT_78463 [Zymoseptoria tritici IPO323]|uniref:Uncharacterized protein n=1 Tax=Zymoseptoria tritici (strain CBS 115943 / IPO323) TaxID=336722 RepID=F9WWH4_ZYMTI|nr:uncharacterized protein MYCGRDRAFT_78463 [Zymoseptoria tritici IPO323]EGP92401.1 hypothetical protein MYCGRDRAFT_78463 [Zymoseptoria tritici IPO323]
MRRLSAERGALRVSPRSAPASEWRFVRGVGTPGRTACVTREAFADFERGFT